MSNENELKSALSKMYSELENLQSAREQVEIVTQSSKDLTDSTAKLLQELNFFSDQFKSDNKSNISQLTNTLDAFQNKLSGIAENGDKSLLNYIKSFKEQITHVINLLATQLSEHQESLSEINSSHNKNIGERITQFEKASTALKNNAEEGIEEIIELATKKIEHQEKEILKTIEQILNTNAVTEKLIEEINRVDIPNSLESINDKLGAVAKENKTLKVMLFVIIGLLAVSIIGLFV